MTESKQPTWIRTTAVFAAGLLFGAFSAVQIAPRITTTQVGAATNDQPIAPTGLSDVPIDQGGPADLATVGPTDFQAQGVGGGSTAAPAPGGLACNRAENGGATDVGVTADRIRLATTTVQSGLGAAFLGEVKFAMEAVKNKVNRTGGICGRLLDITYRDDGWDPARGQQYIKNFIQEGYFAIPVAPSSEGLRLAIDSGDIKDAGIPVVGADGMLQDQYTDPWVWPVAVATTSAARLMADDAYARGARRFSIVFDRDYRFGVEGALAFNNEVKRLTGQGIPGYNTDNNCQRSYCGILAGQSSYKTEVQQFDKGDYVAMFLEPQTALVWMATPGAPKAFGEGASTARYGIGAAQPLFTREFAEGCQAACHHIWVWTGYRPPIESYANEAGVRTYVEDLRATKPDADVTNAFSEGGYTGMLLLVEALERVGPFLTRARLAQALDSMTQRSGLSVQDSLSWGPGRHYANATMRAFEIQFRGAFGGWSAQTIVRDKHPEFGVN